jgi:hypothetical protein
MVFVLPTFIQYHSYTPARNILISIMHTLHRIIQPTQFEYLLKNMYLRFRICHLMMYCNTIPGLITLKRIYTRLTVTRWFAFEGVRHVKPYTLSWVGVGANAENLVYVVCDNKLILHVHARTRMKSLRWLHIIRTTIIVAL